MTIRLPFAQLTIGLEADLLAPNDDRESAIEAGLAPGACTRHRPRPERHHTGVALVEVYRLD